VFLAKKMLSRFDSHSFFYASQKNVPLQPLIKKRFLYSIFRQKSAFLARKGFAKTEQPKK